MFPCSSDGGESLLPRSSETAHRIQGPASPWPTDTNERQPIRNGSGSHDLETPQDNSNGSDDAGSRQGTLQDMDLHCFHPVLVTTPRGGYVIPRCGSNLGIRAFTSWSNIRKRIATKICSASKRDQGDVPTAGLRFRRAVAATGRPVKSRAHSCSP